MEINQTTYNACIQDYVIRAVGFLEFSSLVPSGNCIREAYIRAYWGHGFYLEDQAHQPLFVSC